jgi:hypothetical protein
MEKLMRPIGNFTVVIDQLLDILHNLAVATTSFHSHVPEGSIPNHSGRLGVQYERHRQETLDKLDESITAMSLVGNGDGHLLAGKRFKQELVASGKK